jgi:hypothetical protein
VPLGATGIKMQAAEAFATSSEADTRNLTWSYDNTYRLTQEQIANDSIGNNGTVSYTLDPVGNRTQTSSSITGISSTPTINFDSDDLMLGGIESYDANGNTTNTGSSSFAYDSENHLVSMGGTAVTILYDGDGNRVAKTVGGVTTNYLVDGLNPTGYAQVIEEVAAGTVQREYTYGLQRISENQPISGAWTPSIYAYDGGGSATVDEPLWDNHGHIYLRCLRKPAQQNRDDSEQLPLSRRTIRLRPRALLPPRQIL